MLRNSETRYGTASRTLHWAVAALMITAYVIGDQAEDLRGPERAAILAWHALPGLLVLALALGRLWWRRADPPPPLPADLPGWQGRAAQAIHLALLTVMLVLPATGLLSVLVGARPFEIAALGTITPPLTIRWLHEGVGTAHVVLGKLLVVLLLVHVAAFAWHAVQRRRDLLARMLPIRGA